eukprot:6960817-Ditylum_brightwellii.AAC.1
MIWQETLILGIKTQSVTVCAVIKVMHEKWRIGGGGDKDDADEPNEAALTAVPGKFNSICYKCREKGHMAMNCSKNNMEGHKNKGFCRTCNNCGKVRHKEQDCWDKPEN